MPSARMLPVRVVETQCFTASSIEFVTLQNHSQITSIWINQFLRRSAVAGGQSSLRTHSLLMIVSIGDAQANRRDMLTLQHRNYPTSGTAGTNPDTEFGVLRDANGDLSAPFIRIGQR